MYTEDRLVVDRGRGGRVGEMGKGGQKVQSYTIICEDVTYSMVTIANNTGLHIGKLLREWIFKKSSVT